ncbi:hypothetical protein A2U01_0093004, partial [Trifolium medium]|nr:hypothetical protein [Trifolium medium]
MLILLWSITPIWLHINVHGATGSISKRARK